MSNLEKYMQAFTETFQMGGDEVKDLVYQGITQWDSVGHMSLVAALEDAFDIMFEVDDILDFNSFEKGKELLKKYDVEID